MTYTNTFGPFATAVTRARRRLPRTTGLRFGSPWPAAKVHESLELFENASEEVLSLFGFYENLATN